MQSSAKKARGSDNRPHPGPLSERGEIYSHKMDPRHIFPGFQEEDLLV